MNKPAPKTEIFGEPRQIEATLHLDEVPSGLTVYATVPFDGHLWVLTSFDLTARTVGLTRFRNGNAPSVIEDK